jgi:hypothetical protein
MPAARRPHARRPSSTRRLPDTRLPDARLPLAEGPTLARRACCRFRSPAAPPACPPATAPRPTASACRRPPPRPPLSSLHTTSSRRPIPGPLHSPLICFRVSARPPLDSPLCAYKKNKTCVYIYYNVGIDRHLSSGADAVGGARSVDCAHSGRCAQQAMRAACTARVGYASCTTSNARRVQGEEVWGVWVRDVDEARRGRHATGANGTLSRLRV